MKLISWNCQGAFRKKAEFILARKPDILVVQECENPERLVFNSTTLQPREFLWFGENPYKGVGVFSYGDFTFTLHGEYNPDFKTVVPILVKSDYQSFTLIAICANNPKDRNNQYIGQVWKAINQYDNILSNTSTILIGDFNSNKIWDRKRRIGNHTDVVDRLNEKKIQSLYHLYHQQAQGNEAHPTFYLYRHIDKPYHLDYCFASDDFVQRFVDLEVGRYEDWIEYSDHSPLIINFKKD
jgi:exodeoxyribonuclease III